MKVWSLAIFTKKIDTKIEKNREISTLAAAKQETVNRLVSKALIDQKIADGEFEMILDQMARYNELKQFARAKNAKKNKQSPPNVDEVRKQIKHELIHEYQKKKLKNLDDNQKLALKKQPPASISA